MLSPHSILLTRLHPIIPRSRHAPHLHSRSRRRTSRTNSQYSLTSRQAHLKRDLRFRTEESAARIISRRASGRALRRACRGRESSSLRDILLSMLTVLFGLPEGGFKYLLVRERRSLRQSL